MNTGDDVRAYVGVTETVQIAVWVVLVPSFAFVVFTLINITCCWRRTVRVARHNTLGYPLVNIIARYKLTYIMM